MQQFLSILSVTIPIFALVLCGFVATRRNLLPIDAIPGLSAYILSFALPAMLFRLSASTSLVEMMDLPLILLYTICGGALCTLTIVLSRKQGINMKDAAFGALVSVYPNAGFMGIPLLIALLGEDGVRVIMVTILLVDCFVTTSVCLSMAQMQVGQEGKYDIGKLLGSLGRSLKGASANPLSWPIAAGLVFGSLGLEMPDPINKTITMLSDSASPVALFTVGAIFARNVEKETSKNSLADYVPIALIKLFIHPLLIFSAGYLAQKMGVPISARTLSAVMLVAALPSAANTSMVAERFGADSGRIARIIMVSTVLSFFSFSGLVWLMGIQLPTR